MVTPQTTQEQRLLAVRQCSPGAAPPGWSEELLMGQVTRLTDMGRLLPVGCASHLPPDSSDSPDSQQNLIGYKGDEQGQGLAQLPFAMMDLDKFMQPGQINAHGQNKAIERHES